MVEGERISTTRLGFTTVSLFSGSVSTGPQMNVTSG